MRRSKDKGNGGSEFVTPFVFQQILAYGDEKANRTRMNGVEQQDCHEYYTAMLAGLTSETPSDTLADAQEAARVDGLFEIRSETASVCNNESCDYKGSVTVDTVNSHTVHVPKEKSKTKPGVMDLLEASNISELDIPCPKCGEETLDRVTEFTKVADNFVLHMVRVDPGQDTKIETSVELPTEPIELCGKQYVLSAVIRHRGKSTSSGHYSIFRRRARNWVTEENSLWYHINDHVITSVDATKIKDHGSYGQCAMLLFKAL